MPWPSGFNLVKGTRYVIQSAVSSTATFKAGNPVAYDAQRSLIEMTSAATSMVGIALSDAANSLGGSLAGMIPVLVPMPDSIFATNIATNVARSLLSLGQSGAIVKSGNYFRPDFSSAVTPMVTLVPRGDGSTVDSNDSSVFVQFLQDKIGPVNSNASFVIF